MQEVVVRLRFTQPCLGSVRKRRGGGVIYAMLRDHHGRVLFMPTWWASITRYAAKVLSRHQRDAENITWDPCVSGEPRKWKRWLSVPPGKRPAFALHEAFVKGDTIGVNCVLPASLTVDDLWRLLDIAGRYRGISPHNPKRYGNFEVEEIRPRRRAVKKATPATIEGIVAGGME